MINDRSFLWKAVKADRPDASMKEIKEYIKSVRMKAEQYLKTGEVCDRDGAINDITELLSTDGELALITGGPSVGKSFILRKIEKDLRDLTKTSPSSKELLWLYVDGRGESGSICGAIGGKIVKSVPHFSRVGIKALYYRFVELADLALNAAKPDIERAFPSGTSESLTFIVGTAKALAASPRDDAEALKRLQLLLIELAERYRILVVVDEANKFFTTEKASSKDIHDVFIMLTKQRRLINVLLATSEFSFPYFLNEELKVKSTHLSKVFVIGGVPPHDAYKLLTEDWGLGSQLATRLIDFYGKPV